MIRRVAAQSRFEISLTLRQGERMLVAIGIPVAILLFFSTVDVLPTGEASAKDFLVPGVLALAIVATAMVSQGIATGFERQNGVLKRLGATPLRRSGLLSAKVISIAFLELLQLAALVAVGLAIGWRPAAGWVIALPFVLLGTVVFAGLGFAMAGRLTAEANLAASNGLFLVMLLAGGIIVPLDSLPTVVEIAARALPTEPLATGMREALNDGVLHAGRLALLGAWAAAGSILAVATFRWE